MRFSVTGLALGLTCVAALAAPVVPEAWVPDIAFAPTGRAVPELVAEGQRAAGSLLVSVARADEPEAPPIDFSKLVRIKGQDHELTIAPYVSTDVLSHSRVRKIGYGRISEVSISTTASGVYSTDGLASPHVLYPGIEINPVPTASQVVAGALGMFWKTGAGWVALPINAGKKTTTSFGRINGHGHYIAGRGTTCVQGPGYISCS